MAEEDKYCRLKTTKLKLPKNKKENEMR